MTVHFGERSLLACMCKRVLSLKCMIWLKALSPVGFLCLHISTRTQWKDIHRLLLMEYMETIKSPILVFQCKGSYSCIFIKVKYAKTSKHGVETSLVLALDTFS